MRMATPRSLHLSTRGVKIFSISSISALYSSSVSYRMSSNFFRPSAKLPGLTRILSKHSATIMATLGAKWMSAMRGVSYPSSTRRFLISAHALASCMPWTVMRTISAPASAHFFTCESREREGGEWFCFFFVQRRDGSRVRAEKMVLEGRRRRRRGRDASGRGSRDQRLDALGRVPRSLPAMSRRDARESTPRARVSTEIRPASIGYRPSLSSSPRWDIFSTDSSGGCAHLGDGGLDVARVGGGHRLADDGVVGAHLDLADGDGPAGGNRAAKARSARQPGA